jgi:hypothetical protein
VSATRVADAVRVVAGHGLPVPATVRVESPLTPPEFDELLARVRAQRIAGHLVATLRAGALVATDDQTARALAAWEDALQGDLLLERALLRSTAQLDAAGIAHRTLKGPALARTAYADPALRSFGDVDVLVPGSSYDRAHAVLTGGGGESAFREPRSGFTARFGKGVSIRRPDGLDVDLHRSLCAGPFGLAIGTGELFDGDRTVTVGDRRLPVLSPLHQWLHACYHVALSPRPPRWTSLRDVAELTLRCPPDVDAVADVTQRWRSGIVVAEALRLTEGGLGIGLDGPLRRWAAAHRADAFERRSLGAYEGEQASYAMQAVAGLWALPRLRDRAAYASALLWPDRSYLDERDGRYLPRLRRAVGLARRALPSRAR